MQRDSLAFLLTELRRLIGDPADASQFWSDDDLQSVLDRHRQDYQDWELVAAPRIVNGSYSYRDFWARERLGNWESDATISDSQGTVIAHDEDASEPLLGHWVFASSQTKTLYLTGKSFDLYSAAVEVLRSWAAREKLAYDFSTDNQSFKESQKVRALLDLASEFERKGARVGSGNLINTEVYAHRY
jgi:hypothetical protein